MRLKNEMRMAHKKGSDRFNYLQNLVTEFQDTNSNEAKKQVLANLSNFAFDPFNYDFLRRLNVIDLFLDELTSDDETCIEFAIGGICNFALDSHSRIGIMRRNGLPLIIRCLSSLREETVLSAVTTLIYMVEPQTVDEITSIPVVECMLRFSQSQNTRLSNLANMFLQDCCPYNKIQMARQFQAAQQ